MKSTNQPNLFQHSDAAKARAYRVAADTVRHDPHFSDDERERRAANYLAEAERYEARA
ncbi:hypothetical protein ACFQZQ_03065 [Lysobacter koreensis]|uniref:Uncharacterized protein n=1 Tax=Lysobacter koreensis TaxID=266122 RepID=A0ABW2YIL7_9GAMM